MKYEEAELVTKNNVGLTHSREPLPDDFPESSNDANQFVRPPFLRYQLLPHPPVLISHRSKLYSHLNQCPVIHDLERTNGKAAHLPR
jgi:hypothetical protein